MEQFSILPLGTFPAAGEDQHRGVQAGGIGTSRALGNNDLDDITSAPWERGETTDQLRTTPAAVSAPQRSTMDTNDKWFRRDNHEHPIWGSRGREFKSRQPD